MKDALRLRDDPSAPLSLRRDLDRYSRDTAVPYDADRGLSRLAASLALVSTATLPWWKAVAKSLGTKASSASGLHALAVGVTIGAGVAAMAHSHAAGRSTVAPVSVATARLGRPAAPQVPRASSATTEADEAAAAPIVVAPKPSDVDTADPPAVAPTSPPTRTRSAPAPSALTPRPEAPIGRSSLREELVALVHLREVASTDPVAAVGLAAEDDARYGSDSLYAEEREAIAIDALARSGRTEEARDRAESFLSLHAKSPFAAMVRGALDP